MTLRTSQGHAFHLGASVEGNGVNFALFSEHATGVELCIFAPSGVEQQRVDIKHQTNGIWHVHVADLGPGTRYGYRVYGPYDPERGHRFNANKLLVDPYARAMTAELNIYPLHYGYQLEHEQLDLSFDQTDSGTFTPHCIVTLPGRYAPATHPVRIPWSETQLYELHVKGFTQLNESLPAQVRGKYLGLAEPQIAAYLKSLGITSVELLPVHYFLNEPFLTARHLTNYWGYNSLNFFVPSMRYAVRDPVAEFSTMINSLHDQGIEVLLDVVYNHTAEGNHLGPTICYRGIDNRSYYRLEALDNRLCVNDTGCGNTLNTNHPRVMQLIMDSLRYWVSQFGVDGFRFDLATVLGRENNGYTADASIFKAISQDPTLKQVKLIAEPWDLGPGGYQLGHFPPGWSEWNDIYRDTVRRFWRGDAGFLPDFARLIHGGSDLFEPSGRTPSASINMVTGHDGFTLRDLVTYEARHNEANFELNRDGHSANYSRNYGIEGPADDPCLDRLRFKQMRNLIMTLAVSQGVPMYRAGDELGHSQLGNNNAYCQDNHISWIDWRLLESPQVSQHLEFVRAMVNMRREFAELRCPRYIHDRQSPFFAGLEEILWYHPNGNPMTPADWQNPEMHALGLLLDGTQIFSSEEGPAHRLLILFNSAEESIPFELPLVVTQGEWQIHASTALGQPEARTRPGDQLDMEERSMCVLVFKDLIDG